VWLLSGQERGNYCKIIWRVVLQAGCVLTHNGCPCYSTVQAERDELREEVWTARLYPSLLHSNVLLSRQNQKPNLLADLLELTWADFPRGIPMAMHKQLNAFFFFSFCP